MKISILMPIWITNDELGYLTINALNSLGQTVLAKGDSLEFIVLDNGSTSWVDHFVSQKLDYYIRVPQNKGYPWAINTMAKVASGDYLAIANNDIKVSDNWWLVAKEIFKRVKDAGTVHYKMLGYDQPTVPQKDIFPTGKERWCHGSFFVIKKSVFEELGYDEGFGLGGYDDYDFYYRMREKGYKQVYTNGAFFNHRDSSTQLLRDPEERRQSDDKNREYYKSKHGEYPDAQFQKLFPEQFTKTWKPFP